MAWKISLCSRLKKSLESSPSHSLKTLLSSIRPPKTECSRSMLCIYAPVLSQGCFTAQFKALLDVIRLVKIEKCVFVCCDMSGSTRTFAFVGGAHAFTPNTRLISAVGQCSFALPGMRSGRIGPDSLQACIRAVCCAICM